MTDLSEDDDLSADLLHADVGFLNAFLETEDDRAGAIDQADAHFLGLGIRLRGFSVRADEGCLA